MYGQRLVLSRKRLIRRGNSYEDEATVSNAQTATLAALGPQGLTVTATAVDYFKVGAGNLGDQTHGFSPITEHESTSTKKKKDGKGNMIMSTTSYVIDNKMMRSSVKKRMLNHTKSVEDI